MEIVVLILSITKEVVLPLLNAFGKRTKKQIDQIGNHIRYVYKKSNESKCEDLTDSLSA